MAASGILSQQGGVNGCAISLDLMMDRLKAMVAVGAIQKNEIPIAGALIDFIYRTELSSDWFFASVEGFLEHQRIHRVMMLSGPNDLGSLHAKLGQAVQSAKITQAEPCFPLRRVTPSAPVVVVPTGIPSIDQHMNGGHARKEYGILLAYTGVGKTTWAINIGWGGANQGYKTALATLELDEDKIKERLYSLVGRYPYSKIRFGDPSGRQTREEIWDEVDQRVMANSQGRAENFQIWDFSKETCNIQMLEDWLHREQDRCPEHPPDQLIVDWILCLGERPGFNPNKLGDKEVRHRLQRYGDELSKLAVRENIAVWATHQADAKAEDRDTVTIAHSAEGKSAAWKCSVFLGLGATHENREAGVFTVTASKMRDGRIFKLKLRGMLDEQRFEDYEEEVDDDDGLSISDDIVIAAQRRGGGVLLPSAPPVPSIS